MDPVAKPDASFLVTLKLPGMTEETVRIYPVEPFGPSNIIPNLYGYPPLTDKERYVRAYGHPTP